VRLQLELGLRSLLTIQEAVNVTAGAPHTRPEEMKKAQQPGTPESSLVDAVPRQHFSEFRALMENATMPPEAKLHAIEEKWQTFITDYQNKEREVVELRRAVQLVRTENEGSAILSEVDTWLYSYEVLLLKLNERVQRNSPLKICAGSCRNRIKLFWSDSAFCQHHVETRALWTDFNLSPIARLFCG